MIFIKDCGDNKENSSDKFFLALSNDMYRYYSSSFAFYSTELKQSGRQTYHLSN